VGGNLGKFLSSGGVSQFASHRENRCLSLVVVFDFQGEGGDKRGGNSNLALRRASREFLPFGSQSMLWSSHFEFASRFRSELSVIASCRVDLFVLKYEGCWMFFLLLVHQRMVLFRFVCDDPYVCYVNGSVPSVVCGEWRALSASSLCL